MTNKRIFVITGSGVHIGNFPDTKLGMQKAKRKLQEAKNAGMVTVNIKKGTNTPEKIPKYLKRLFK